MQWLIVNDFVGILVRTKISITREQKWFSFHFYTKVMQAFNKELHFFYVHKWKFFQNILTSVWNHLFESSLNIKVQAFVSHPRIWILKMTTCTEYFLHFLPTKFVTSENLYCPNLVLPICMIVVCSRTTEDIVISCWTFSYLKFIENACKLIKFIVIRY